MFTFRRRPPTATPNPHRSFVDWPIRRDFTNRVDAIVLQNSVTRSINHTRAFDTKRADWFFLNLVSKQTCTFLRYGFITKDIRSPVTVTMLDDSFSCYGYRA